MKIGVALPNHWGVDDPSSLIDLGVLAEELGFDSVWTGDHLLNTGDIGARLKDKPYYHPMGTLSFLAARTSRITLGTSVMVLPYHNPVELAKYAATLDQLSGGRLILGVGAGGVAEEFEALGIPLRQRASLTNEAMTVMKALWTQHLPEVHTRNWRFSDLYFSPKPLQQPHVPLWVGGTSEGAMQRAALLGDGWHPAGVAPWAPHAPHRREGMSMTPDVFAKHSQAIRDSANAVGRNGDALAMTIRINGPVPEKIDELVTAVAAYEAAGAVHAMLAFDSGDTAKLETVMRQVAATLLPRR